MTVQALPPPAGQKARRPWNHVLDVSARATKEQIEAAYREKAKKAHPDAGGSAEMMHEINQAKEEALQ